MHSENTCFLITGSNLGDKLSNLEQAANLININAGTIVRSSSIYETEPWGHSDQPVFLNQVLQIRTKLSPPLLMEQLLLIEKKMGRQRTFKNASRNIDIDILFYDDQVIHEKDLDIPHKSMQSRRFVLVPLQEIAPDFIHPELKKSISELLIECSDPLHVNKIE